MHTGDVVPDFELPDQTGTPRSLSGFLAEGPVVLFFYPAAMTYGCTKESCHFRDMEAEFAAVGAQRVGISADTVDKQKQFDEKESLGFPLLSDPDFAVAGQLGAEASIIPQPDGSYSVEHSSAIFVVDPFGRLTAILTGPFSAEALQSDFRRIVGSHA